MVKLLKLILTG